jgi:hypothetical protein
MTASALRAPRVLVVSLRKSGTQLIREVAEPRQPTEVFAAPDQPLLRGSGDPSRYPPRAENLKVRRQAGHAEAIRTVSQVMNEVCASAGLALTEGWPSFAVRRLAADVRNRAEELSFSTAAEESARVR